MGNPKNQNFNGKVFFMAEASANKGRLIDKPILPTLLHLAWPIVTAQFLQLFYNLADTFWVGQLGSGPLAAISVSFPLVFLVLSLAGGFAIAGVALVSQYTGAEEGEDANRAAGQVIAFSVALSLIFSTLGLIFGKELLVLIGAGPDIIDEAWAFFRVITAGIPLIFVFFVFAAVLQGLGDTITPMKLRVGSVLFNIVLDPFLIFGWWIFPDLGVAGAAYATVISRLGATAIGIYLMFTGWRGLKLSLSHFKPDFRFIPRIVRIGIPAAVGTSSLAVAMTFMTSIVAGFGTNPLAAFGVGNRILAFIRMPSMGVGRATGILVGQHLGADQRAHAGRTAWTGAGVILVFMFALALLFLFVAPHLMRVFSDDPEVIQIGTTYLRIGGFAYMFLSVQQVLGGALEGAGRTMEKAFFLILNLWFLQVPLAYLFAYVLEWGLNGIWLGILLAKIGGVTAILTWFSRGTWKQKLIEEKTGS